MVADASASSVQTDGIAGAMALWRDHGAAALGAANGASLEVKFELATGAFHGLYDDRSGVIYVNERLTDPTTLSIVLAHELGHAFGLHHVSPDERPSVMNPGNLDIAPTDEDRRTLEALWGVCPSGS